MTTASHTLPRAFITRRLHSLFGLWLVLFLIEHIVTNSQSALLFHEDGRGFIQGVNFIKNLPFLPFVEIFLIGVPILFHGVLGIKYLLQSKMNSFPTDETTPKITKFGRNHAYSFQRITSWILLVGIILHVGYMRFYRYPAYVESGSSSYYFVRISEDPGLYTISKRLHVELFDQGQIRLEKEKFEVAKQALENQVFSSKESQMLAEQEVNVQEQWFKALTKKPIGPKEVIAMSEDFGTATLLMVRDSFKSPLKSTLYTIFVLAASFHAFNGFWTFLITWGIVLRMRSQKQMVNLSIGIMILIAFLGLACVWGTYWLNLFH